MAKYQKKSVTVEAQQLIEGQPLPPGVQVHPGEPGVMFVTTIQGRDVVVQWDEWIIAEPDGVHYYPCDPVIFAERYEASAA